jgi:hypothetical protein
MLGQERRQGAIQRGCNRTQQLSLFGLHHSIGGDAERAGIHNPPLHGWRGLAQAVKRAVDRLDIGLVEQKRSIPHPEARDTRAKSGVHRRVILLVRSGQRGEHDLNVREEWLE